MRSRTPLAFVVAALVAAAAYVLTTSPLGNVLPSVPADSLTSTLPSWPAYRAASALGALLGGVSAAITPSTTRAVELSMAYMQSEVLHALLYHNVLDSIVPEGSTADQLAQELGLHAPTLRRFLLAADTLGVVKHNRATDLFTLTPTARALRADEPANLRPLSLYLNSDATRAAWRAATSRSLVSGESGWAQAHGQDFWSSLEQSPTEQALFDQAMVGMTRAKSGSLVADWTPPASAGGQNATICDIGGGLGAFLAEWLRHHPHVRGLLVEQPAAVARAGEYLASRGVAGRATVVGASFLKPLPEALGGLCGVFFVKSVLHNWPDKEATMILTHIREAAKQHAVIAVAEAVLNPAGPASGAAGQRFKHLLDVHMAAVMPAGARERTMPEFKQLFRAAGLPPPTRLPLREALSLLVAPLHPA